MMQEYHVTIQSQMGPREGVLALRCQGGYVTGWLDLVGYLNAVRGVQAADGTIRLFHPIKTVVSTISCETVLHLNGEALSGTTTSETARMRWEGALLRQKP